MNKVTIFKYEENKLVRTMSINDEPWFVLKDVCDVLGLSTAAWFLTAWMTMKRGSVRFTPLAVRR